MDPLTHVLAGALTASFSGNHMSLSDPVFLGAVLGSLAPDLDILYQTRGDMAYLKNHRGFSHSFIGVAGISVAVAGVLTLLFPGAAFLTVFLWTLAGTLSHIFLDVLNSYGAQILWPLSRKKFSLGILTIFDPIIICLMVISLAGQTVFPPIREIGTVGILIYLLFRVYMLVKTRFVIKKKFPGTKKIIVLPSVISIWNWHFLLENHNKILVGEVRFLSWALKIRRSFRKQINHPVVQAAVNSKLGKLFQEFTPIFHVGFQSKEHGHLVNFIDLRYFMRDDFLHHATGIVNNDYQLMEGIFHPYNKNRQVKIAG
ncbi:MAG: metal-dependent hydrolase [Bacillota bacterium]